MKYLPLIILWAAGCTGTVATVKTQSAQSGSHMSSEGRLPQTVIPMGYRVHLKVDPAIADYSGEVEIGVRVQSGERHIILHSLNHEIKSLKITTDAGEVSGVTWSRAEPDYLVISATDDLPSELRVFVEFSGQMTNPLFGMYRVKHRDHWYIYSQMEPLGAREAFPCFDEPGFKTPFEISITAPAEQSVFGNAPKARETPVGEAMIRHDFRAMPPMPTYLFALAVGPIDVVHRPEYDLKRADGTMTPIRILAPKGEGDKALLALREAGPILAIQEEYFGSHYPYEKLDLVAVPDFAAGAMENPGLITYRDRLLLMDENSVTQGELRSYASIHAHELAHMWFGNLVTMSWWDDLWLNEAFATWFASKTMLKYRPDWNGEFNRIGRRSWVMDADSNAATRRIRQPIVSRGDIENAFDGITYSKGAAILHMFEAMVGTDNFRTGVRKYLKANAWSSATFADLLSAIEQASGRDGIAKAMGGFIDQTGVPHLRFDMGECTAAGRSVRISQQRWQPIGGQSLTPGEWSVPVCINVLGQPTPVCTVLDRPEMTMHLPGCPDAIVPNPGAHGYYVWSMPEEALVALSAHLSKLTEFEQVDLLANLRKLYLSGDLSPVELANMVGPLLEIPSTRIRNAALDLSGELGRLVSDADRPAWDRYRARLIVPLLSQYGWDGQKDDPRALWDLRRKVLRIAGNQGHLPHVMTEARRRVDLFLQGHSVERETLGTAMAIVAEHGDESLFNMLVEAMFAEDDAQRRRTLMTAATRFRFPGFTEKSFKIAADERLKVNERGRFIWAPARDRRTRVQAWKRVKDNLTTVTQLLTRRGARYLPYYPISACEPAIDADLVAVFESRLKGDEAIEGMSRKYVAARDSLARCIGLRSHYGAALKTVLAPYAAP